MATPSRNLPVFKLHKQFLSINTIRSQKNHIQFLILNPSFKLSFLFYCSGLLPNSKEITLPEEEGRHALRVLRMKEGDEIQLLDGNGGFYKGIIKSTQGKKCLVQIIDYQYFESNRKHKIHLALAPTKNTDRIEWFVEKAIEIGVDKITFLLTSHSERKVLKMERIQKIAVSAMKQSGNFYLPELVEITKFKDFLESQSDSKSQKFMAYVPASPSETLFSEKQEGEICVLIGPSWFHKMFQYTLALSMVRTVLSPPPVPRQIDRFPCAIFVNADFVSVSIFIQLSPAISKYRSASIEYIFILVMNISIVFYNATSCGYFSEYIKFPKLWRAIFAVPSTNSFASQSEFFPFFV